MAAHVLDHPLVKKLLTDLRDETTVSSKFRELARQLTYFLVIEATRKLKTKPKVVKTPLTEFDGIDIAQSIVVIPILRAGLSMLQPSIDLLYDVSVGYIGMERDETTALAHSYYCKLPEIKNKFVIVVDPMLATGHSAELALAEILKHDPSDVAMVSMISAPDGIKRLESSFPNISIFTGAIDDHLTDKKFIFPGLGDFGDRAFQTI